MTLNDNNQPICRQHCQTFSYSAFSRAGYGSPICASLSTNVNLSVTDLWQIMQFCQRTAHFDRLSCAIDGRCSVIGWIADILCQIIDRNFTRCYCQFLLIGSGDVLLFKRKHSNKNIWKNEICLWRELSCRCSHCTRNFWKERKDNHQCYPAT